MTGYDYQKMAMRTRNCSLDNKEFLEEALMGLSGESGECIDILKKHKFQGHKLDRYHLISELGDVAWYLAAAAEALGTDLDDVFNINITKLYARYPDGFACDKSINRSKDDI